MNYYMEVGVWMNTWNEVYESARSKCHKCRCCNVCNGVACKGETPGPGGKGSGRAFMRNVELLSKVALVMDTIVSNEEVDTSTDFFQANVSMPVYAAPISGILQNYGAELDDLTYTEQLVKGCLDVNTLAFTGDGMHDHMFLEPLKVLQKYGSKGIATIKPWVGEHMKWRIDAAEAANLVAIASDIDASGLTNLRKSKTPVEFKSVEALKELRAMTSKPLILKGILSVEGAKKALEAGADAIIVSNHGGRVLDDSISAYDVLRDIKEAVQDKMKILVDGGIRSGADVFKCLALGADGVLIGRPISHAVIGGGSEGVRIYLEKIQLELKEAMAMCGCKKLSDITIDKVKVLF